MPLYTGNIGMKSVPVLRRLHFINITPILSKKKKIHFIAVISVTCAFISLEIVSKYNQCDSVAFHSKYFLFNAIFNQYGYLMGSISDESNIGPPCNQNNQY